VVRIREVKKEIFPSLLDFSFFPLIARIMNMHIKFSAPIFKDFWDKRTIGVY